LAGAFSIMEDCLALKWKLENEELKAKKKLHAAAFSLQY
jgi:hypothetical protein